ncbi:hypothetical protein Thini_0695 [Thiothrix nivea DSM 5205]|uniref:Uncharacterized protein n=1 Tax=Thiothrix nivea (strain ATCC 35100 / DSM 5205 / JP2) TaxID=870187 RepID=A0A656HB57_THINJ|nr:hypothetical protein Thini_0695 [Thiothrix nivea DSM 5205]
MTPLEHQRIARHQRAVRLAENINLMDCSQKTAIYESIQQLSKTLGCSAEETILLTGDYRVQSELIALHLENALPHLYAQWTQGDTAAKAEIDRLSAPVLALPPENPGSSHHGHHANPAKLPDFHETDRLPVAHAAPHYPMPQSSFRRIRSAFAVVLGRWKVASAKSSHQTT